MFGLYEKGKEIPNVKGYFRMVDGSEEVKVVLVDAKGNTLESCHLFALNKKDGSIRRYSGVNKSMGFNLGSFQKLVTN